MKKSRRDSDAGFALVESIAVLALAALVFVTLLIATDLVSRNSAAAARRSTIMETLMTGLAAVRNDLEGARFIRIGEKEEDPILFSGSAQRVAVAVADDRTGLGNGESLVLIQTRYDDGQGALVRSSAKMLPKTMGFGSAEFGNAAVLVSGPWRYLFSYADMEAGAERWRSTWTATARMPAAIRLEVLGPSGARVVPPLTVRIAIDSGGCGEAARTDCAADEAVAEEPPTDEQNPENPNEPTPRQ
jgi:type II secretory pathway component PulJ